MITKEEFIENTNEDEIFCLIEEFIVRVNEKIKKKEFEKDNFILLTDSQKIFIITKMIESIRKSIYLGKGKHELRKKLKEYLREKDKTIGMVSIAEIEVDLKARKKELDEVIIELLQDGEIYEPKPQYLRWLG